MLDIDLYLAYARTLIRFARALDVSVSPATRPACGVRKRWVRRPPPSPVLTPPPRPPQMMTKDARATNHAEVCRRSLAQATAMLLALAAEYCPEALGVGALPLFCEESGVAFNEAMKADAATPPAGSPSARVQRALCAAPATPSGRHDALAFSIVYLLGCATWALTSRGGDLALVRYEGGKLAGYVSQGGRPAAGTGTRGESEGGRAAGCLTSEEEVQALWTLLLDALTRAVRLAPDPASAAEAALTLHDASVEFLASVAVCGLGEAKEALRTGGGGADVPIHLAINTRASPVTFWPAGSPKTGGAPLSFASLATSASLGSAGRTFVDSAGGNTPRLGFQPEPSPTWSGSPLAPSPPADAPGPLPVPGGGNEGGKWGLPVSLIGLAPYAPLASTPLPVRTLTFERTPASGRTTTHTSLLASLMAPPSAAITAPLPSTARALALARANVASLSSAAAALGLETSPVASPRGQQLPWAGGEATQPPALPFLGLMSAVATRKRRRRSSDAEDEEGEGGEGGLESSMDEDGEGAPPPTSNLVRLVAPSPSRFKPPRDIPEVGAPVDLAHVRAVDGTAPGSPGRPTAFRLPRSPFGSPGRCVAGRRPAEAEAAAQEAAVGGPPPWGAWPVSVGGGAAGHVAALIRSASSLSITPPSGSSSAPLLARPTALPPPMPPRPSSSNLRLEGRPLAVARGRVTWSAQVLATEIDRRAARQASMDEGMRVAAGEGEGVEWPDFGLSPSPWSDGVRGSPRSDASGSPCPSPIPPASLPSLPTRLLGAWPVSVPSARCWPSAPPKHSPLSPAFPHWLYVLREGKGGLSEEAADMLAVALGRALEGARAECTLQERLAGVCA